MRTVGYKGDLVVKSLEVNNIGGLCSRSKIMLVFGARMEAVYIDIKFNKQKMKKNPL